MAQVRDCPALHNSCMHLSTLQMRPTTRLPVEMLDMIVGHVPSRDLSRLVMSSRLLNVLARKHLQNRVQRQLAAADTAIVFEAYEPTEQDSIKPVYIAHYSHGPAAGKGPGSYSEFSIHRAERRLSQVAARPGPIVTPTYSFTLTGNETFFQFIMQASLVRVDERGRMRDIVPLFGKATRLLRSWLDNASIGSARVFWTDQAHDTGVRLRLVSRKQPDEAPLPLSDLMFVTSMCERNERIISSYQIALESVLLRSGDVLSMVDDFYQKCDLPYFFYAAA